jgi:Zn-finger nucleic acid-binding protein
MSGGYRDAATATCPACAIALTPVQQRLVCESCHHLLIPRAELDEALFEVGGQGVELVEGAARAEGCPRCASPLVTCRVRVTGVPAKLLRSHTVELGEVAACREHGVWLSQDALATMLATVGRATSSRGSRM